MSTSDEHVLSAGGLAVRFVFRGDRFGHEVWLDDGPAPEQVLASVEGTADDGWPPSPPFQSLNRETRPDGGQVILLVGMAGKCHWSASVELDAARTAIRFDVACRAPAGTPGFLGSNYRLKLASRGRSDGEVFCGAMSRLPQGVLLSLSESVGPARAEILAGAVRVVPAAAPTAPRAQTIRWGYELTRGVITDT